MAGGELDVPGPRFKVSGPVLLVLVGVLSVSVALSAGAYRSSIGFHAGVELVGALLGIATGFALLVRFLALGERFELLAGLAFLVNAAEDLVHGLLSYLVIIGEAAPGVDLDRFAPSTYAAGRFGMSAILLIAALGAGRLGRTPRPQRARDATMAGIGAILLAAAATAVVAWWDAPRTIHPEWVVPRPGDLVSALLFLGAFVVLERHRRRPEANLHLGWLAIAAGLAVLGQVTISLSTELHDAAFDLGHLFKVAGYAIPLQGLVGKQVRALAAEQAMTERLLETEQLRNAFLSTVTHELRTPLVAILGFTDVLLDEQDPIDDEQERIELLSRISRNAAALGRLIDDLLEFGRLQRGALTLDLELQELAPLTRSVVHQLGPVLRDHVVEPQLTDDVHAEVDVHAYLRVLTNLLTNAVRYSPKGGRVTVTVTTRGDLAVVAVADEGPGVPVEEREVVFAPFYRGEGAAKAQSQGTGIGLAVARDLAREMGGDLVIDDSDAGGACFELRLPVADRR